MVDYVLVESEKISIEKLDITLSEIRSIPPQVRGRIVSSGNHILPLSRTKKLNLKNTPILLFKKRLLPIDVYPHLLGTNYSTIEGFLARILSVGPEEYLEARGILEDPLVKILSDFPESLEDGAVFVGANIETEAGVIDALLKDSLGTPIVVEVETRARDSSIAQVCRLAAGYANLKGIPIEKIRKVILCLDYEGQLLATCDGSNVEFYKFELRRIRK